MIKVENLTKIYDRNATPALDGVNFCLPDNGFVFIVGKSGSGKSTLLNILGGLDNVTSGDVIADGNRLSKLKESEFDDYRNSYVGFIFQDFCLIESLTVKENIKLALDLQSVTDDEKILKIIKRVDLEGFEDRVVKKLSGGQKQRVAIARALIKEPKLILADESTGNLDSKTSSQILDLLKELSKESLVLIVSHNTADAYKYADRIIEISDGKILQDTENSGEPNELVITSDAITLPYNAVLSDDELEIINSNLGKKIKQRKPRFNDSVQPVDKGKEYYFKKNSLKPSSAIKLSFSFFKKRAISFVVTAFLLSALLIILGVCQMFTAYDGESTIKKAFENSNTSAFILRKGYLSDDVFKEVRTKKLGRISDAEIQNFYDNGYEGKVYRLTNATMGPYRSSMEHCEQVDFKDNFEEFYAEENLGLLECDLEFLTKIFGNENGQVEVLAGSLDYTDKPYGMILTDYMADSFIYHHRYYQGSASNPYQKLLDGMVNNRFSVVAVINTNYKTRHAGIMQKYTEYFSASTRTEKQRLYKELTDSDEYAVFITNLPSI